MSSESQPCSVDVPSYTVEQVEGVTSEYMGKNSVSVSELGIHLAQALPGSALALCGHCSGSGIWRLGSGALYGSGLLSLCDMVLLILGWT